jgi:hypothetical protein
MICQTSPAQSAFRDEGRRLKELQHRLHVLHQCGEDSDNLHQELLDCIDRQLALLRWIDWQWSLLFDRED